MSRNPKYSFEYIKNFAKENGCLLLNEGGVIKAIDKIKVLCSCKENIITASLFRFLNGQIVCNECSKKKSNEKLRNKKKDLLSLLSKSKYQYVSGEYFRSDCNNLIVKDNLGYYYKTSFSLIANSMRNYGGIGYISKTNPFSLKNIKNWIKLNNKNFKIIGGHYEIQRKKTIKLSCNVCNEKWHSSWELISKNTGCPYCSGKKIGKNNSFGILFPEFLDEWDYENNVINPYEIVCHTHKKVFFVCKKCKNRWDTRPDRRIMGEGCPRCSLSKGETSIKNFLNKNNIYYIREYKFKDCKYKKMLRFDFYIPNIKTLLEFQGKQHYEAFSFVNKNKQYSEENLRQLMIRDNIKKQYCKDNNIRLLEIPYWDFKNIDNILTKEILEYVSD